MGTAGLAVWANAAWSPGTDALHVEDVPRSAACRVTCIAFSEGPERSTTASGVDKEGPRHIQLGWRWDGARDQSLSF